MLIEVVETPVSGWQWRLQTRVSPGRLERNGSLVSQPTQPAGRLRTLQEVLKAFRCNRRDGLDDNWGVLDDSVRDVTDPAMDSAHYDTDCDADDTTLRK